MGDLALVFLGCWVNVGDHGRGVGHEHGVHDAPGHHADHDDPHLHVIWSTRAAFRSKRASHLESCVFDGKKSILTCGCVHGSVRQSDHLGESSENPPGVLDDDCGVLKEVFVYSEGL